MEPSDILRKRLYYQSWHRGTREADFLLGTFADQYLSTFERDELRDFEALLSCADTDIFTWLQGTGTPPLPCKNPVGMRFYAWVRSLKLCP